MIFKLQRRSVIRYLRRIIRGTNTLTNLDNRTVLLIEDEPIIAWEVEKKLNRWGFINVIVKESMSESQDLLLRDRCDIVISNLRLIDGWIDYDFVELLKKGKTHLVLLTGLSSLDLHKIDWSPINPKFLFKPYTALQLREVLAFE